MGDSITAAGCWNRLFPNVGSRNFGVDGDCSGHLLNRLRPIVEFSPSKLFLMIGTNDLGRGIPEATIVANVATILDELKTAIPRCHIHLQTVLPREAIYAARVQSLNAHYDKLARARELTMIDLFPAFADDRNALRRELTGDGLHLLEAGYEIWRALILRFVS